MTDVHTEAEAIADLAQFAVEPNVLDPAVVYGVPVPASGDFQVVDLEHHLPAPRRKKGTVTLTDGESFAAYVNKHKTSDVTELYADSKKQTVIAVLNDDAGSQPGWRDHRALLQLRHTDEWDIWLSINGQMLDQVSFAEFIESNAPDIVEPDAATMLELAQTFQAKKDVDFKSSRLLDSGQRQLTYHEQQTASAGANGTIEIPAQLVLGLAPFEIGESYRVTARFRYRLIDGDLRLGIKLDRIEDVIRSAFSDVIGEIQERTGINVLYGTPAS